MTTKRRYRLLCPIARSLDAVGDRWTLLILRDLHAGPARFQELEEGLGLATNLLSSRLSSLIEDGLVAKQGSERHSPYALTDLGRRTDRILWELSRFGSELDRDDDLRPPGNARLMALPLSIMLDAVADRPTMVVRLHVDDDTLTISSSRDRVEVVHGETADEPQLEVRTSYEPFMDLAEGLLDLTSFARDHREVIAGHEHAPRFFEFMASALAAEGGDSAAGPSPLGTQTDPS